MISFVLNQLYDKYDKTIHIHDYIPGYELRFKCYLFIAPK